MVVTLDGRSLSLESVMRVAEAAEKVKISSASIRRMQRFRSILEEKLNQGQKVYGVNTGFGSLSNEEVSVSDLKEHQLNLIRSHSAGVGNPMPEGVVRAAILLRLNSLLNGNSAARSSIAVLLAEMLNEKVTPYVPSFGSLGASGDLTPSAHVALTMVGEGKAYDGSLLLDSTEALRRHGLKPVELAAKEGLSLINGTCFTTAFTAICIQRGRALLAAANAAVAMTSEVLGACAESFDERLLSLKKNRGQEYVARQIRVLLKGSGRIRTKPLPQDPYSIRCAPQVHGSLKEALDFAERITVDESNSVSDNPIFLDDGTVLHGGNFHAQPSAMASDLLSFAIAYLGVISLARIHLLLAKSPPDRKYMTRRPGFESGLMILEYTASSLTAENAKHAYPLSSYPANVSGGIEDHASYGVNAGMKAMAVTENVSRILAIEMICCSNFASLNEEGLSTQCRSALRTVRRYSPLLKGDRAQGQEIELLSQTILAGRFLPGAGHSG